MGHGLNCSRENAPNNGVNRSAASEFAWFHQCYMPRPVTPGVMLLVEVASAMI
jgi:hypothetical protein